MTIDEAIAHEKELAREIYVEEMLCHANPDGGELDDCIQRGKYHEQLAEWLEELKSYREIGTVEECRNSVLGIVRAYNKALDDFVKFANAMPNVEGKDGTIRTMWLEEIAEQLKAGGKDEQKRQNN